MEILGIIVLVVLVIAACIYSYISNVNKVIDVIQFKMGYNTWFSFDELEDQVCEEYPRMSKGSIESALGVCQKGGVVKVRHPNPDKKPSPINRDECEFRVVSRRNPRKKKRGRNSPSMRHEWA